MRWMEGVAHQVQNGKTHEQAGSKMIRGEKVKQSSEMNT